MKAKKLIRFDWAMKYILRDKANFDVLEGFLSNLLNEEIKVEDILESASNPEKENRKFNCVDLKCKDSLGRQIIIEVQNQREVDYFQRILWGTSKVVVESLHLGSPYKDVAKVISISILYYPLRMDEQNNKDFIYHGTTEMYGIHNREPLILHGKIVKGEETSILTSSKIFPEYYMIYVEKFEDEINEAVDEWIYFFKHGKILDTFKSPGILLAAQKLDYLAMNEEERLVYEDYMAYISREIGIMESAAEDGELRGIVKGRAEGRAEGERIAQEKMAKNLLAMGMKIEDIVKASGLSIEDINRL